MQYGSKLVLKTIRDIYTYTSIGFRIRITSMFFLLLAMLAISGCDSVSTFSHIEKIATLETLKNKIDELGDMINFSEFPLLSLKRLSVVTSMHYVCYLDEENQSGSSLNK